MRTLDLMLGVPMPLPLMLSDSLQRFSSCLDAIRRAAIAQRVDVWLVGGFIRDALLARPQFDVDLITSSSPEALGRAIARDLGGHFVMMDPDFGVGRIVAGDRRVIDLARMQGDTLDLDLKRRDLTINALALPLVIDGQVVAEAQLIDPLNGLADLERKRIRALSIENLLADPVRLIRVFRFGAALDFEIDFETLVWVDICKRRLTEAASERTTAELFKILSLPHAFVWVERLFGTGLLGVLLPEFAELNSCPPRQELTGIALALEVLRHAEDLLQTLATELHHVLTQSLEGDATQSSILKLGALLLAVGNPPSGNTEEGLAAIRALAQRLKLSSKAKEFLLKLLGLQDEADALIADPTDPVALFRFFRSAKDATVAILLLALAQHRALGVLSAAGMEEVERRMGQILEAYFRPDRAFTDPQRLIDGQILMKELALKPGKQVGELLEGVLEAQLRGEIETQEEAIAWARRLFNRNVV